MEIMKIMEKLLNKISKYDIFVNYIPGCAIVFILKKVFDINLLIDNVALDLCLIYFYGIISKYIGTFLYKAINKIGLIDYVDYDDYISRQLKDKERVIIRNISMLETIAGATILVIIISFLSNEKIIINNKFVTLCVVGIILIYLLIKNTKYQLEYLKIRFKNKKKSNKKKPSKNESKNSK